MENYLFLDTETTGFKRSGALVQPKQARVCQIAMILTDNEGGILAEMSHLIKPEGWIISDGAYDCHGISQQECEMYGLPSQVMMNMYYEMAYKAQTIVAHNSNFDKGMMDIEMAHSGERPVQKPWYCTQENSKEICCIPPTDKMKAAGRYHYKTPSLAEALKHFTGEDIEGAHDAMVDTRACKDVFFAMRRKS